MRGNEGDIKTVVAGRGVNGVNMVHIYELRKIK